MLNDKVIKIELEDYILFDKLNSLAVEYTTTVDSLINISIHRLFEDIEFVRQLRIGKTKFIHRPDEKI